MEGMITYQQQDTTKVDIRLEQKPGATESGGLRVKRAEPVPLTPIQTRGDLEEKTDTPLQVEQQVSPAVQMRYNRWLREQNLKIGDSRFIPSKNEVKLVPAGDSFIPGLVLPSHDIQRVNTDWLTMVLLFALILFASVRSVWSKYLGQLFQSVFNYSTAFRIFWEKNFSVLHGALRLDVFFFLIFSLFLFQTSKVFHLMFPFEGGRLYLLIVFGVLGYFFVKKLLYQVTGILFENTNETSEFIFNLDNFKRVTGIALAPVVVMIAFFPLNNLMILVGLGFLIVASIYFLLLYRGIVILLKKQFSIIYLFLYFCTLEFVPLVLVYKILVR